MEKISKNRNSELINLQIIFFFFVNGTSLFSCADVCMGDRGSAPADEAGRGILLLRSPNNEGEDPDVVLRASPRDPHLTERFTPVSHPEPQRTVSYHRDTGNIPSAAGN